MRSSGGDLTIGKAFIKNPAQNVPFEGSGKATFFNYQENLFKLVIYSQSVYRESVNHHNQSSINL